MVFHTQTKTTIREGEEKAKGITGRITPNRRGTIPKCKEVGTKQGEEGKTMTSKKLEKPPWFSTHKPKPPSEEAIKMHKEMMKKLLPLIKEVFPDMEIGKAFNKKEEKI